MYTLFKTKRKFKTLFFVSTLIVLLFTFGAFTHLFEKDFFDDFHYPYDGDIAEFVQALKSNITPEVSPINRYYFHYNIEHKEKCLMVNNLRLVYIIKSAPENVDRRLAIRSSWGYEHRFSDVEIRTVFLLGIPNTKELQYSLDDENRRFKDLIQANFTDTYYNNTYKTMMGFQWAATQCSHAKFFMFIDDDYYISTKNVLRFLRYPTNYPQYLREPLLNIKTLLKPHRRPQQVLDFELEDGIRLYAGYVFKSSPLRHLPSKWYVSLEEYPYHMWPPYATAGAFILSREALIDLYYSSFYTKHFRFDDIYVGLLAYKAKIEPYHCDEFHFYKKSYNKHDYEYTIASHGYSNHEELMKVWTEQKSMGNA